MPHRGDAGSKLELVAAAKQEWLQMGVDEAVDALPVGPLQFLVFLAAVTSQVCMAAFAELFIYVRPELVREFQLSEEEHGMLQGVGFYSQLLGFLLSGTLLDRVGRKPLLTAAAGLLVACFALESMAHTYLGLLQLRFVSGVAPGVLQTAVPVYLSEFLGSQTRGYYVSLFNVGYPVGACVILGFVALLQGAWRSSFVAVCYPAAVLLALFIYLPESPRYLASIGKRGLAIEVVQMMHRGTNVSCPEIHCFDESQPAVAPVWGKGVLNADRLRTFYGLAPSFATIAFSSVGLRNWLPEYLQPGVAGARSPAAFPYASVLLMSLCDLVGCWSGAALLDRAGRQALLLTGFAAAAAATLLLLLVPSTVLQSMLGGVQQLAQAWVWVTIGTLVCELFPTSCRGFFSGLLYALASVFMISSPVVGGWFFDHGLGVPCLALYGAVYAVGAATAARKLQHEAAVPGVQPPHYGAVSA